MDEPACARKDPALASIFLLNQQKYLDRFGALEQACDRLLHVKI